MEPWFEAARADAEKMLLLAELIGEGDWTPQDIQGVKCARRILGLLERIETRDEVAAKAVRSAEQKLADRAAISHSRKDDE